MISIEQLNKDSTLCYTGHRPQSLPWGSNETNIAFTNLRKDILHRTQLAIDNGWNTFLTGMAIGIDTMCAEIVIELKKKNNINLVAVIPCVGQEERWNPKQKARYQSILKQCDLVITLSDKYYKECMNDRNKYMVNHSSACIAIWNGDPSGTGNTVRYAREQGCKVRVVNPKDFI